MQDLEEIYEGLLAQLPVEAESAITLNAKNCPVAPDEISARNLKLIPWRLGHSYGDSARYDVINFFADKPTYRRLGLLLFSSVFHPNRQFAIYPTHQESGIFRIRVECRVDDPLNPCSQLVTIPVAYGYCASPVGARHPLVADEWRVRGVGWGGRAALADDLPFLELTNESGGCVTEEQYQSRSVVVGFGSAHATAALAALMLDIGLPQTELSEFSLEGPSGNWSVAIGSAEARFWIGYDYVL